jgi:glycosyltransferase involved in cell wall biosynthesis
MKPICVCGHFAFGKDKLNGQTIKTKITTQALADAIGEENLMYVDTAGIRCMLMLIPKLLWAAIKCDNILIFPARKGLRVIIPILAFLRLFSSFKTHHLVIGGWLANFLAERPSLEKMYAKVVSYIYVETTVLGQALKERGYSQTVLMPNFKSLKILQPQELPVFNPNNPLQVCTFSRVMERKGIDEAVWAVSRANEKLGRTAYNLTIYGPVERGEEEWFEKLLSNLPDCAKYGGVVPYDKSTEVLQGCFALLFPTHFYTEGVPGTLIDAYASGVPVISSRWESFADVVSEGETGYGYAIGEADALCEMLVDFAQHPDKMLSLRTNCLNRAKDFLPQNLLPILLERLN